MEYMLGNRRGAGSPPKWLTLKAPVSHKTKKPKAQISGQSDELYKRVISERQQATPSSSSPKAKAAATAKTRTVPLKTSAVPPRSPGLWCTAPSPKPSTNKDLPRTPPPASPTLIPLKATYDLIPDPKGYYKALGVLTPDTKYIHDRQSAAWNRIIQQRYVSR